MRRPWMAAAAGLAMLVWAAPASAAFTFVNQWGAAGTGPGQFNQPRGLAVSASGDVYVADSLNNRVQRFTADGSFVSQWGSAGAAAGQFQSPYGIGIGPTGDVFVVDRNNHRVQRFTPAGAFVSQFGTVGSGAGQLSHPSALAMDSAGSVYVADYDNRRVVVFDANGAFVRNWGSLGTGNGQFQNPDGIAVANGQVYVIDGTNRVQIFTETGIFITSFGAFGTGNGQFNGTGGVAAHPGGDVLVTDFNGRRVERFSSGGAFVETFGSGGTAPGQFNRPGPLVATPAGDVYVSDVFAQRIVHFREVAGAAVPPPVVGKTVNVRVVRGTVRIKLRGSKKFVRLTDARQVPVGSTVDTLRGTVELTSAADRSGGTQTGQFYKGVFVIAQKRAARPVTDLRLNGGKFRGCPKVPRGGASKAKKTRRLWGNATGRFRTVGRYASATVRGTTWLTQDNCTGTLVRVTQGAVTVRDLVRKRNVLVKAPGRYFARARR